MSETAKFIQGVFGFRGAGLAKPVALQPGAKHAVPADKRAQLIYLRAGNSSAELVCLVLTGAKKPLRYFPIGAKDAIHVPLAIVQDIDPETELELCVGAPEGLEGSIVVDFGLLEIE
jgi:hypothetical protein